LGCETSNRRANNEMANMRDSSLDENTNVIFYVTWKGVGWLRWLNKRMVNIMVNKRLPCIFPQNEKANAFFHVTWKVKLISWDG
jgi:hypothetical protein